MPDKNLRELLEALSYKGFSSKYIDLELCLYKDYGDFDLEGSALDNHNTVNTANIIYLWDKTQGIHTFASIYCKNTDETKEVCLMIDEAVETYAKGAAPAYPFNLLYQRAGNVYHQIVKHDGKWIEGYFSYRSNVHKWTHVYHKTGKLLEQNR